MKLALYDNRKWYDLGAMLIKWWTSSSYSHCELIIGNDCFSSSIIDGGVRKLPVSQVMHNDEHWETVDILFENNALEFFKKTEGTPYGWSDIVKRQIFNIRGSDYGFFCSEWCSAALGIPNPSMYSPETLKGQVEYLNKCVKQLKN